MAAPDPADAAPARSGGLLRGSAWSVLDQGLFAGSNFAVNVLLARWLSPEAYGSFAVAFTVFLLAGTLHGGLFTEPMLVFGPGRFESRFASYVRGLLRQHVRFAALAGALLMAAGAAFALAGQGLLGFDLAVAGGTTGVILVLWMLRRACYVVDRPDWAAGAGALYLVVVVGGAAGLWFADALTGAAALMVMAAGSAAAALALGWALGLFRAPDDRELDTEAFRAHVHYGKWAAPTGGLEWIHTSLPLLVLPLFVGLEGSGTLRALYNLALPALHAFAALALIAMPLFVRARASGEMGRVARTVGGGMMGLGLAYAVTILLFGRWLVDVLYRGQYEVTTPALLVLAALPLASALSGVLMAWLRSDERPDAVFRARAAAVGAASTVGVALTALFSVAGALASDLLSLLVEAAVQARLLRRGASPASAAAPSAVSHPLPEPVIARPPSRLHALVSAYACRPGAGSEPGVGWNLVREMARHHDLTVLVYEGFRSQIEPEIERRPIPGVRFVYHAMSWEHDRHRVEGVQRHGVMEQYHYVAWQKSAAAVAARLHAETPFDLGHHVTFVKYWAPSLFADLGIPYIWGPVGGGESAPGAFYPALSPAGLRYERKRDIAQALSERLPSVRRTARNAALAFATTDETAERVRLLGAERVEVRSAIGLPLDEIERLGALPEPSDGPLRFLCIGRQIAFKGFRFGIEAFARAVRSGEPALQDAELWLVGEGPEHDNLRARAEEVDIASRVHFTGRIPRERVLELLGTAHALVHPSLHESGGGVCLEAMAAGRPVVGFDLGGTTVHVSRECGMLVEAITPEQGVADLAEAIRRLAADPELRAAKGACGRDRVRAHFQWGPKTADMAARYWAVAGRARPRTVAAARTQPEPA